MGRITRFAYDRLSRLVAVVLPNPATGANPPLVDGISPEPGALVTRYAYDEQGNKISQTDAEGRITRWTFDGMGRQRSRVLPMGQQEQFEYDLAGQPSAHLTFNGERIETSHDSLGRIATLSLPGGHVRRFAYSPSGQVAQIDDHGAVYAFEYDTGSRLTRAVDPQGRAIDYRYDAVGNRTELSTARQQIRYAFDELHRLREVVAQLDGGTPQTTEYRYDAVGNRSGMTQPNGTTVEYAYDLRNRLSSLVHRARQAAGAAVLLGLTYTVDASGLRTELAETRPGTNTAITRTSAYTYDWVKRLTREQVTGTSGQNRTSSWTYDKVGNRKTESDFPPKTWTTRTRKTRRDSSPEVGRFAMRKSKLSEEQIALALKQAESITSVEEVCREMVVSRATFYLWRKKYGGLGVSELCRRYRRPITNPQSELLNASHLIASTRAWVSCAPVFVEASPCKGIRKLSST